MENLLIFIAIIVFVTRLMKKIKKAVPGGKKPAAKPAENHSPQPYKDKLEEMIRNMEEAEKQKAAEKTAFHQETGVENEGTSSPFYKADESFYEEVYKDEEEPEEDEEAYSEKVEENLKETNKLVNKNSDESELKTVFSQKGNAGKNRSAGKSVLASLARYQGMQKAVILKEILDSPVSSKY